MSLCTCVSSVGAESLPVLHFPVIDEVVGTHPGGE